MKNLIVICVMLFSVNAYGWEFAENWTKKDTAYQGAFLAVTAVDMAQTRWAAIQGWIWHGHKHKETCPVLSEQPTISEVDAYFPAVMVAHTLIALALPSEAKIFDFKINPRRIWQCVWIGIETGYAINNYSVGVRIEF